MLQVCKIQRKSFFKTLKEVVIFVCKFGMDGLVSWRRSNHIRITEQLWSHSFQHFWKELWTKRWTCTHTLFWNTHALNTMLKQTCIAQCWNMHAWHYVETRMFNTFPKPACIALCWTAFCHLEETIVALLLRHDPHGRRLPYSWKQLKFNWNLRKGKWPFWLWHGDFTFYR